LGFYEIVTNSMLSENIAAKFGNPVSVLNPQSSEMSHIRPSLLPGMLTTVANNLKVSEKDLMLFELGKIINKKNNVINSFDDFDETENCIAIITGNVVRTKWYTKDKQFDLYDLKGVAEALLNKQLPGVEIAFEKSSAVNQNYQNSLNVLVNKKLIGEIGELKDSVAAIFDVNQKTYALELSIDELKKVSTSKMSFNELLKFPKVYRDCAFVLDAEIESGLVVEVIKQSSTNLLHNVILFDIFQSESLGKHKKSLAFQLEYFDLARTLTEEEVEKDFRSAIKAVETKFTAQLRGT
ncbi:MAG: phenylalanine--tRNA ligase subunit beta, partial [Ignavibacteria bacterium]|nr:phenylalanine--tRNA ligase subunit beta [Ignavibacteria bacterium]